jgi:hypothetical protein
VNDNDYDIGEIETGFRRFAATMKQNFSRIIQTDDAKLFRAAQGSSIACT